MKLSFLAVFATKFKTVRARLRVEATLQLFLKTSASPGKIKTMRKSKNRKVAKSEFFKKSGLKCKESTRDARHFESKKQDTRVNLLS